MQYKAPPKMALDLKKKYTATIQTTKGDVKIDLHAKKAPMTVNNFVFLAREKFYDGVTFHRVIPDFMAQGGDPTGTGRGDAGYKFPDETSDLHHVEGALSMEKAGSHTNGSKFFIVYTPQPHLNGKHSVFGQVVSGMDVAKKLANGDKIVKVTIEEKAAPTPG